VSPPSAGARLNGSGLPHPQKLPDAHISGAALPRPIARVGYEDG
jgi:hypothetical protein